MKKKDFADQFSFDVNLSGDYFLLLRLTQVAALNFNFIEYCNLINLFASWNSQYKHTYHADRMFKKSLLKKRVGKNFPINSSEDFKCKLLLFNEIAKLRHLTYLDILDLGSLELINGKINLKKYFQITHSVLKFVDKLFEREICKRVHISFKE